MKRLPLFLWLVCLFSPILIPLLVEAEHAGSNQAVTLNETVQEELICKIPSKMNKAVVKHGGRLQRGGAANQKECRAPEEPGEVRSGIKKKVPIAFSHRSLGTLS